MGKKKQSARKNSDSSAIPMKTQNFMKMRF